MAIAYRVKVSGMRALVVLAKSMVAAIDKAVERARREGNDDVEVVSVRKVGTVVR